MENGKNLEEIDREVDYEFLFRIGNKICGNKIIASTKAYRNTKNITNRDLIEIYNQVKQTNPQRTGLRHYGTKSQELLKGYLTAKNLLNQ